MQIRLLNPFLLLSKKYKSKPSFYLVMVYKFKPCHIHNYHHVLSAWLAPSPLLFVYLLFLKCAIFFSKVIKYFHITLTLHYNGWDRNSKTHTNWLILREWVSSHKTTHCIDTWCLNISFQLSTVLIFIKNIWIIPILQLKQKCATF